MNEPDTNVQVQGNEEPEETEDSVFLTLTRAKIRALKRTEKTRFDDSSFTKASTGSRRKKSRQQGRVAKQARKVNR